MTKRALITGITGMVGSHLLDYLLKHTDWEIHGTLRWLSPLDNISGHLDDINAVGRINLHYADLRDTMAIQNCAQAASPDLCISPGRAELSSNLFHRAARYAGYEYSGH